jgi:hypothetical protein
MYSITDFVLSLRYSIVTKHAIDTLIAQYSGKAGYDMLCCEHSEDNADTCSPDSRFQNSFQKHPCLRPIKIEPTSSLEKMP